MCTPTSSTGLDSAGVPVRRIVRVAFCNRGSTIFVRFAYRALKSDVHMPSYGMVLNVVRLVGNEDLAATLQILLQSR